jgi:hypothetical protein
MKTFSITIQAVLVRGSRPVPPKPLTDQPLASARKNSNEQTIEMPDFSA